jgi:hypothetical protein
MKTKELEMELATEVQLKRVNGNKIKISNTSLAQGFGSELTTKDLRNEVIFNQLQIFFNELTNLVRIDNLYRGIT